jgi:hypothetical protein
MLKRRLLLLAGAALVLVIGACGGGSDGFRGFGGGSGDPPPASGPLSVEQRALATGALADRFQQITGGSDTTTPAQWEELRAWVMTQPDFVDAGVGDQLLWARFRDGRYFLYTDNWRPLPTTPQALARAPTGVQDAALLKQDVPASADALLLADSHPDFADAGPVMTRMAAALKKREWTPSGQRSLSVETLKAQGELGFLFLTAHSGIFGPTGEQQFAMITDDVVTIAKDFSYSSELEDTSLIYHRDRRGWEKLGLKGNLRYAITARFVDRYLRFSPESLVILVSCNSGSPQASAFRDALRLRGAGTVIGWEGNSNPLAFPAMDLMVDRLAGTNAVDAVTPPNRAFNFKDVWEYLDKKKKLETPSVDAGGAAVPVRRFGGGFSLLQPVLAELEATGIDKLLLHGDFGQQAATVTVGGKEFAATTSADGKLLEVQLGPVDHGEVVVTSRKRKSNPRVLGSWRGQVTYKQTLEAACDDVEFSNSMTINVHLRADAHAVRDEVDEQPRNSKRLVMAASDTKATWRADGSCSDRNGIIERWSGTGELPLTLYDPRTFAPTSAQINLIHARIDAVERRFQFVVITGVTPLKTVQTSGDSDTEPLFFSPELHGFFLDENGDFENLLPIGTFLPFSSTMAVTAGNHRKAQPALPREVLTIDWGAMPVAPAYDDNIGR